MMFIVSQLWHLVCTSLLSLFSQM